MKIGALAKATATPVETIRFYEREGLMRESHRTEANYRVYDESHIERLVFIRHCRSLDMTLDEIRQLLHFMASPQDNCAGVNELLEAHIGHVAQRIRELRLLEKQLKLLRDQCAQARPIVDCGILKGLSVNMPAGPSVGGGRKHVHGAH